MDVCLLLVKCVNDHGSGAGGGSVTPGRARSTRNVDADGGVVPVLHLWEPQGARRVRVQLELAGGGSGEQQHAGTTAAAALAVERGVPPGRLPGAQRYGSLALSRPHCDIHVLTT